MELKAANFKKMMASLYRVTTPHSRGPKNRKNIQTYYEGDLIWLAK